MPLAECGDPEGGMNESALEIKKMHERLSKNYLSVNFSTLHLIMEVDFCPVLCTPEVPVLQAFQGIGHFVWYCKAVSDLS